MLRLRENIETIFNENQLQKIEKIINDFETMEFQDFYKKYDDELFLQNCEWVREFCDIEEKTYVYEPFSESYKKDYLDLLICWIMYIWDLGFMVSGSELQNSYEIIELIDELIDNKFEIQDTFGQEILIKSFIQDVNYQLSEKKIRFVELYIEGLLDTRYYFLFDYELADKLTIFYDNELFGFNEVTTDDYICSFYFDASLKEKNSKFKYKHKIKQELSSQIKYLLKQGIKNFLITLFDDIDLIVLELFNKFSKEYGESNLKCYVLNQYKDKSIEKLLNNCECIKLKNDSSIAMERCIMNMNKDSTYVAYFGFMKGYGVVKMPVLDMKE